MNITVEKNNGLFNLQIEGEMTIFNAAELKENLIANLTGCSELEIDLSQVSEMDTAGFQLLYLLKRESALLNRALRITSHSQATLSVLELFNMDKEDF